MTPPIRRAGTDRLPDRTEIRQPRERSFDNEAFFAALDLQRTSRSITWKKVADEANVSASTLTRIAQGRRPDVDSFAALVAWAGLEAQHFIGKPTTDSPRPLTQISALLRRDPNLTPEAATAIEQLVKVTYEQFRRSPPE
ncbi:MAG: hypothetical protein WKF96_17735 [Solirubrobacteraceae bacterium]